MAITDRAAELEAPFVAAVRTAMADRGVSQYVLARAASTQFGLTVVTNTAVSKMLTCTGQRQGMRLGHALAFASVLDVDLNALVPASRCTTCAGKPPPGFICASCGLTGGKP